MKTRQTLKWTISAPFILCAALCISACGSKTTKTEDTAGTTQSNPLVPLSFGPNYKYSELMIKDYDEMLALVQGLVKKAHAATSKEDTGGEAEAVEQLGRALKLIYSRPDNDNMVAKLVNEVRRELQGFNAYEDTIAAIANEAITNIKNDDATTGVQATALVELENILTEIRPEAQNGNAVLRAVIERIRDARIRLSDEIKRDRRMRGMLQTKNPSEEAKKILAAMESKKKK